MQESNPVKPSRKTPVLRISVRRRIMGLFTFFYTVAFFVLFNVIHSFAGTMVSQAIVKAAPQNMSVDMAMNVANSVLDQMWNVELPIFLVSLLILIALLFVVSYGITRPLRALTRYAERVAAGDYTPAHIPQVTFLKDEVSTLSEVFETMVSKVREREQTLTLRVQELQITIDEARKARQVEEIVDSEFFTNLKDQVRDLKARKRPESSTPSSEGLPKTTP